MPEQLANPLTLEAVEAELSNPQGLLGPEGVSRTEQLLRFLDTQRPTEKISNLYAKVESLRKQLIESQASTGAVSEVLGEVPAAPPEPTSSTEAKTDTIALTRDELRTLLEEAATKAAAQALQMVQQLPVQTKPQEQTKEEPVVKGESPLSPKETEFLPGITPKPIFDPENFAGFGKPEPVVASPTSTNPPIEAEKPASAPVPEAPAVAPTPVVARRSIFADLQPVAKPVPANAEQTTVTGVPEPSLPTGEAISTSGALNAESVNSQPDEMVVSTPAPEPEATVQPIPVPDATTGSEQNTTTPVETPVVPATAPPTSEMKHWWQKVGRKSKSDSPSVPAAVEEKSDAHGTPPKDEKPHEEPPQVVKPDVKLGSPEADKTNPPKEKTPLKEEPKMDLSSLNPLGIDDEEN